LPPKSLSIAVVALNYSPEPTGIGPFAAELAHGLKDNGHRVSVIAGCPHYPQWRLAEGYERHDIESAQAGIPITRKRHYIPGRSSFLTRSIMEISFGIRAAFTRDDADLIFCISPPLLATTLILMREKLRRRPRPLVVWVQDLYGLGVAETKNGASVAAAMVSRLESQTFRRSTALVVIHDRFRAHIVDQLGVPGDRVRAIRNWSRQEPIPAVGRNEALRTLGWEDLMDYTIVLHAGNIGAKQGLENVVKAAQLADEGQEKVMFVLLGDGNQRPRLEGLAEGVKSIRFVDVLEADRFGYALRAADVLLVNQEPGVSEMCVPSKLLSYYSAARPVIAAVDADGITADDVRDAAAGIVVAPGDPARLLKEAAALARDKQAMREMGDSGRNFIQNNYARETTIAAISDWLTELAATASGATAKNQSEGDD
jgi:glycosyltransferase involved in cell wall biosynthesis